MSEIEEVRIRRLIEHMHVNGARDIDPLLPYAIDRFYQQQHRQKLEEIAQLHDTETPRDPDRPDFYQGYDYAFNKIKEAINKHLTQTDKGGNE